MKLRAYDVYRVWGGPVCGVFANSIVEAVRITREIVGPGSYYAFRVSGVRKIRSTSKEPVP